MDVRNCKVGIDFKKSEIGWTKQHSAHGKGLLALRLYISVELDAYW